MNKFVSAASLCLALVVIGGCASTNVTARQSDIGEEKIARPDRIIVYDFVASPDDITAESALAGQYANHSTPQTPEQIATGRKLGAQIAKDLVGEIQDMGLPAVQAAGQAEPQTGDIVIEGYLLSVEEGSAGRRVLVGFGSGNAELKTMVEVYQMTETGLRRLGSGELNSGGGKTPGMLAPLAIAAATANPIGVVVAGSVKLVGEGTGSATIEGAAKRTAEEIGKELQKAFEKQGWI